MTPKGEDVAAAIVEWSKDEIKNGPADLYDLGKFFFTVASASAGILCTVAKLGPTFSGGFLFSLSLLLYVAAICTAMIMVRPKLWTLDGGTDLFAEYDRKIRQGMNFVRVWFGLWLVATLAGVAALFPVVPPALACFLFGSACNA